MKSFMLIRCSVCLAEIGSDNKILGITNLQDKVSLNLRKLYLMIHQVITVNIGEFGIVLTRKIVLGILCTLLLILTVYIQVESASHHIHGPGLILI